MTRILNSESNDEFYTARATTSSIEVDLEAPPSPTQENEVKPLNEVNNSANGSVSLLPNDTKNGSVVEVAMVLDCENNPVPAPVDSKPHTFVGTHMFFTFCRNMLVLVQCSFLLYSVLLPYFALLIVRILSILYFHWHILLRITCQNFVLKFVSKQNSLQPAMIELGCLVWFAVFVPNDNVCVLLCFPASLCEY